jgi:hypothetical protein
MTCELWHLDMKPSGNTRLSKATHGAWITSEAMQHKDTCVSGPDGGQWLSAWNRWCSHVETPYKHSVK